MQPHCYAARRQLSPSNLVEMIVIYAEKMRDLVNHRPDYLVVQFIRRKSQLQVWAPENVDNVGQLAGVVRAAFRQRYANVKAKQTLPFRVQLLTGFVEDQHLDIVQTLVNPIWQAVYGIPNSGFELKAIHAAVTSIL